MYLLDTNVLSELRKIRTGRCDAQVSAWLDGYDLSEFYLSVINILELRLGILLLERRDPKQAATLQVWLDEVLEAEFHSRILPFGQTAALVCARLHVPDPRPERDAMIAATALVHDLTLVTRNVTDFETTGVRVLNPWLWEG